MGRKCTKFVWNSSIHRSTETKNVINEEMFCKSHRLKLVSAERMVSKLRRQMSSRATLFIITVGSVCSSRECAHRMALCGWAESPSPRLRNQPPNLQATHAVENDWRDDIDVVRLHCTVRAQNDIGLEFLPWIRFPRSCARLVELHDSAFHAVSSEIPLFKARWDESLSFHTFRVS